MGYAGSETENAVRHFFKFRLIMSTNGTRRERVWFKVKTSVSQGPVCGLLMYTLKKRRTGEKSVCLGFSRFRKQSISSSVFCFVNNLV